MFTAKKKAYLQREILISTWCMTKVLFATPKSGATDSTRQGLLYAYGCGFCAHLQVQEPKLWIYMYFGPDHWAGVGIVARIEGWWR
jgi:hypothetical protein